MNRRLLVDIVVFALPLVTVGCPGGTSSVSSDRLDAAPDGNCAWIAETDAHIMVQNNGRLHTAYKIDGSPVEFYRSDGLGSRTPLLAEAVRYRYDSGTVFNGAELKVRGSDVIQNDRITNVTLPEGAGRNGKLAFSSSSAPKRFLLSIFVEGSYEVVPPVGRRVDLPILESVRSSGYDTEVVDDRLHTRWNEVIDGNVVVQFYPQCGLGIFAAVVTVSVLIGGTGILYCRQQIRALRDRRQEFNLDVRDDDR